METQQDDADATDRLGWVRGLRGETLVSVWRHIGHLDPEDRELIWIELLSDDQREDLWAAFGRPAQGFVPHP